MTGITLDGRTYNVRVVYGSLKRGFAIKEGSNSGVSIKGRDIPDIKGTAYTYKMEIEPDLALPEEYDEFYEAISEPVAYHVVEFPYGQDTITYQARILSGDDVYEGKIAGYERWKKLSLQFVPMEPQRA